MSYKAPNEPSVRELQEAIKTERMRLRNIQYAKFYNRLREQLRRLKQNDGRFLRPLNPEQNKP